MDQVGEMVGKQRLQKKPLAARQETGGLETAVAELRGPRHRGPELRGAKK